MAASRTNRFRQLQQAGQLLEVKMDTAAILLPGNLNSIGTQNLNGCTGIAVLGQALILAHIAPLPPHPLGTSSNRVIGADEGDKHFERLVDEVKSLFESNKRLFPARTTAWGIFGRFRGDVAMPEKVKIAEQRFSKLGLPLKPAFYDVQIASLRADPAAGTVIGLIREGKSYLFVEDKLLHTVDFSIETAAPPRASESSSSSVVRATLSTTTTASPTSNVQGVWVYTSRQQRWGFQMLDGTQIPQPEWPAAAGTQRVYLSEEQVWSMYNFSTRTWQNAAQQ